MIIENFIDKSGWKYIEIDKTFENAQTNLSTFKDDLYNQIFNSNINLNDAHYDEILKSSLRSALRYSSYSFDLLKIITKKLNTDLKLNDYYINLPYFLIHLSSDTNEIGDLHTDIIKECGESFTSWTSINNYDLKYNALSLYENTHNMNDFLFLKIFSKLKLTKFLKLYFYLTKKNKINISPGRFTSLIWSSNLIHIGNLNTASKKHIAMTVKISEFPHLYEKSYKISNLSKINNFTDNIQIKKLTDYLLELDLYLDKNLKNIENLKLLLQNFTKILQDYPIEYHKAISFSSSIISQRFKLKLKMNKKSYLYDLISIIFGKENLISFERILKFYKTKNEKQDFLNNLNQFSKINLLREKQILERYNISLNNININ